MQAQPSQHYRQHFLNELERLNPAQRKAVETTEGSVLVIAGPGTGKTQVLAARIGYILLNTDSKPENILCLTYTEAGALAMRNRLTTFIGPDAYRVKIETFHSFCNEVIQENPDYFGYKGLQPISDLEKIEVLRELVDSFDANHPLKRWTGDVYYETGRLDRLFQLMKTEDWTAEQIEEKTQKYIENLPFREEYTYKRANAKRGIQVGDLKTDKIELETQKMEKLVAAAKEFNNYQQLLKKRQRYDFADMILWVLQAFKQHADLLYSYQERFLYFLVDEFQDTSGSQNELLSLLTDFWDSPNVFAVGDDDQSIYRFQGANVKNIEDFALKYAETLQVVILTENYRSVPHVLTTAHALIENNKERLINHAGFNYLKKDLVAANANLKELENKPIIRSYANTYHEIVHISHQLQNLHQSGVDLNDVAIIYRNHRQCDDLVKYLEVKKIPYHIKKKINLLNEPLIFKLITILRYIALELDTPHSGEYLLFEIMHFDFFDIPPIETAKLSLAVSKQNYKERTTSFREQLLDPTFSQKKAPSLFDQHFNNAGMKRLGEDIDYWLSQADNLTLPQLLEKIINNSGILASVMKSTDKFVQLEMLKAFFDFAEEEFNRSPTIHVSELIRTLDLMYTDNIDLAFTRTSGRTDGVNLITAHSSKGLEFDYVFLLGCNSNIWDKGGRTYTYSLPDTLISDTVSKDNDTETEEARRLFFVALTRAKKHLAISYAMQNPSEKELERSRFVAEIEHLPEIEKEHITLSDEELSNFIENLLQPTEEPEIPLLDKQYLNELLKNYSLSVTHLSNYLRCPVAFYFNNLLRVPAPQNEYMAFGSAVHNTLESLFRKMLNSDAKQFPTKEQMLADFKYYMMLQKQNFIQEQYERRLEYGLKILPDYYDNYINSWNKIVTVERAFRNIMVDGVPLNGKMDKIEFDGKEVTVVDYKTGNHENAKKKIKPPVIDKAGDSFENEYGGDYWRQAVFYKLLLDFDKTKDWEMQQAIFDFVEPDKKNNNYVKHVIPITTNDTLIVREQIQHAYNAIKNHQFSKGCGKEDCEWCNFTKFNKISLV